MLQTDTSNRFDLGELCDKLSEVLEWATERVNSLKIHSRKTDPVVLQALLNIENKAQKAKSSGPKTIPLNHPTAAAPVLETLNPPQRARATNQVHKSRMIQNKPLGQTPHRKAIIEKELKVNTVMEEDNERPADGHNGATTDSPTTEHPGLDTTDMHRRLRKRHPEHFPQAVSDNMLIGQSVLPQPVPHVLAPDQQLPYLQIMPEDRDIEPKELSQAHYASPTFGGSTAHPPSVEYTDVRRINSDSVKTDTAPSEAYPYRHMTSPQTSDSFGVTSGPQYPTTPGLISPTRSNVDPTSPNAIYEYNQQNFPSATTRVYSDRQQLHGTSRLASPSQSHFGEECWHEPRHFGSSQDAPKSPSTPSIQVSRPIELAAAMSPPRRRVTKDHATEKQAIFTDASSEVPHTTSYQALPPSALHLPYDVCTVRREVDYDDSKGRLTRIKSIMGREERKADKGLTQIYGSRREIVRHCGEQSLREVTNENQVFVVDNGATMFDHWPIVVFVAETLVKKAAGLDKSGVDLKFTIDATEHDKSRLRGDAGRKQFRAALDAARPDFSTSTHLQTHLQTDMFIVLDNIVRDWEDNGKPPTTLLVLTDGIWANTNPHLVDQIIFKLAGDDLKRDTRTGARPVSTQLNTGPRPFSIQFIRFGDLCVEKLDRLDNELCSGRGLRDIVDHCSWRSTVDKMFKGSIDGLYDQYEAKETPITHNYRELVKLFLNFNENSLQDAKPSRSGLLPYASPRHSISRSPSRDSTHESQQSIRQSMPPPQRESWQSHHRGPLSQ